jgi:hypothetical protein
MDTRSRLFEGRFGRLFRALPPADFGKNDVEAEQLLIGLAQGMIHDPDCPTDGADPEESGIPAAYTYLGQFIDHDITFDPASSLMRQNDPDALVDFRTPRLDLDSVYGRGPDDQPYLYADDKTLLLGRPLHGNALTKPIAGAFDLARAGNHRAIIGDRGTTRTRSSLSSRGSSSASTTTSAGRTRTGRSKRFSARCGSTTSGWSRATSSAAWCRPGC